MTANTAPPRRSLAHSGEQRCDLALAEAARPARLQVAQLDWPDRGADEAADRVTDLGKEPPHDVLATLVEHDLHEHAGAGRVDDPERVDRDGSVLKFHAIGQLLAEAGAYRSGHLGQVRLSDLVRRVHQLVRQ